MSVIIDKKTTPEIIGTLEKLNINYIKTEEISTLYEAVSTHPDMQIHFVTETCAVAAPAVYNYYKSTLPSCITLHCGTANPGSTYPDSCAYNVAKLGKKVIGNLSYTDKKIIELYASMDVEFINVKQGYTKCNLCIVSENAVITEDEGLLKALSPYGIEVLKITPGSIRLKGFDYGFIGGASGFIAPGKLAFTGDITTHPEYKTIKSFINSHSVDIIKLSSTKVDDFGSILYLP